MRRIESGTSAPAAGGIPESGRQRGAHRRRLGRGGVRHRAASDWPAVELKPDRQRDHQGHVVGTHNFNPPGITELPRSSPSSRRPCRPTAQEYLRLKGEMDALRSEWHGKTDTIAQRCGRSARTARPKPET